LYTAKKASYCAKNYCFRRWNDRLFFIDTDCCETAETPGKWCKYMAFLQYILEPVIKFIGRYDNGDKTSGDRTERYGESAEKEMLPGRIKNYWYDTKKSTSQMLIF